MYEVHLKTQEVLCQWITLAPSSGHVVQFQDSLCHGWTNERYLRTVFYPVDYNGEILVNAGRGNKDTFLKLLQTVTH